MAHEGYGEDIRPQNITQVSPAVDLPATGSAAVGCWDIVKRAGVGRAGRKVRQQKNHDPAQQYAASRSKE